MQMFMDTSQKYYESVMGDFKSYGRGRSREQFCRGGGRRHRSLGLGQRATAQCDLFDKIMAAAIRRGAAVIGIMPLQDLR